MVTKRWIEDVARVKRGVDVDTYEGMKRVIDFGYEAEAFAVAICT